VNLHQTVSRLAIVLVFLLVHLAGMDKLWSQDCGISEDILISANSSSDLLVNVQGLINDDLGSNQSLCGVRMVFSHDRIENIRITLISPFGQELVLAGPGRLSSDLSPFINWNILFNACSEANMPDPGISGIWGNEEPWASFNNYMGTYDPFGGCLEEFNMGSANGTWVLRIENLGDSEFQLRYFEIIFCDNSGIDCEECLSFPGDYDFNSPGGVVALCEGQNLSAGELSVDLQPVVYPEQQHRYVFSRNDTIIKYEAIPENTDDLPPGFYTICSIIYNQADQNQIDQLLRVSDLELLIVDRSLCAGISAECISLRVLESINEVMVDTTICEGDTLDFRGIQVVDNLDTILFIQNFDGTVCDSIIHFSARINRIDFELSGLNQIIVCGQSVFLNAINSTSSLGSIDSYTWSTVNGELGNTQGPIVELRSAGNYVLTLGSGFCVDSLEFEMSGIDTFDWDIAVTQPLCFQDSFSMNLVSPVSDVNLNISGAGPISEKEDGTFCMYEEGRYMVEATFGNCIDSLELELDNRPSQAVIGIDVDTLDCQTSFAEVRIESNVGLQQIIVNGPQMLENNDSVFLLSTPGDYTLEILDANGCVIIDSFSVVSDASLPEFTVSDINNPCELSLPSFDLQITSQIDSVIWTGPSGFSSNELNPLPPTTGTFTLTVFGANACSAARSINVSYLNNPIDIELSGDPLNCNRLETQICFDANTSLDSIFWSLDGSLLPENDTECILVFDPGLYEVLAYDGACFGIAVFELLDLSAEIEYGFSLSDTILSCQTTDVLAALELNGDPSQYSVIWFQDGIPIQNDVLTVLLEEEGEYSVQIINLSDGCSAEEQFSIISMENSFSNTGIEIENPACFPENGLLVLTGLPFNTAFGMRLNGEVIDLSSLPRIELEPGNYDLLLTDSNGCEWQSQFVIEEGRVIDVDLGDDISGRISDVVSLNAISSIPRDEIEEINWTSLQAIECGQCLSTEYQLVDNETVVIEIMDIFGCSASDSIEIRASEFQEYFIPNIFSPNADGNNDDFVIYLSDAINKVFDFRIFDRWGNLVLFRPDFSGDSSNFVWDGFFNGEKAEEGVYIYMAKLLRVDGSEQLITGEITLIR